MASSMIHLAITNQIINDLQIKDLERLRLGCILPDGAIHGNGHLKIRVYNETRSTYDFESFRERFGERMKSDDLYLGYYLHLVQDVFYRYFVYSEHNWDPLPPGNVEKLHRDYELTNEYVAKKYHLDPDMIQPLDLSGEPILTVAEFNVRQFAANIRKQFQPVNSNEECFFFTRDMADDFIERAAKLCRKELSDLAEGKEAMNSLEWSWVRHT